MLGVLGKEVRTVSWRFGGKFEVTLESNALTITLCEFVSFCGLMFFFEILDCKQASFEIPIFKKT